MRNIVLIFFVCFIRLGYSHETEKTTFYSIGVLSTNKLKDIGLSGGYTINKNSLTCKTLYLREMYNNSIYVSYEKISGFGLGLNYSFQLYNNKPHKWFYNKVTLGYLYRNIYGKNKIVNVSPVFLSNENEINNEINIGFINCFKIINFNLNLIPGFIYYSTFIIQTDRVEVYKDVEETKYVYLDDISGKYNSYKFSFEISIEFNIK